MKHHEKSAAIINGENGDRRENGGCCDMKISKKAASIKRKQWRGCAASSA